ncbi:MAG: hypothetical protein KDC09_01415 [Bacteroidales bacterium]|nr:hypothetical protein [Bacteroidales bacterium]
MFSRLFQAIVLIAGLYLLVSSCRKEDDIATSPDYKLAFSNDTIIFDTVFTTVGSTTRTLKVYNRNDKKVKISNIRLARGTSSNFEMNVNGFSGTVIKDIELDSDDSLYIFVRVTVDPTQSNNPLIISDSIMFETNSNFQDIDLVAWGQDAHFYVGRNKLQGLSYPYGIVAGEGESVTWEDDKPYVIYGWAVVDSTGILNIGPGCDIHFHQNSGLWIYRGGSIKVNGLVDSVVTFQGDRLEAEYKNLPGQWDRIWINEGAVDNEFNYAVVKNGFIGIQAEITRQSMGNKLVLNNTMIQNMSRWGLFTIGYRVEGYNSIFANCAENTAFFSVGGLYDFRQCTFANFWNQSVRLDPSFTVSNNLTVFDADGNPITFLGDLNASFRNCIIYGNLDEELVLSEDKSVAFEVLFQNCDIRTEDPLEANYFVDCIKNAGPKFIDVAANNYRLDTLSPVSDIGNLEVINGSTVDISKDFDGNSRIADDGPDLGAFEFVPAGKRK